jgi:hypothetical protein
MAKVSLSLCKSFVVSYGRKRGMLSKRCSQTSMFASGVGLGAAKGHEIGKHPDGYAGYLSKGKDMVS